MQYQRYVFVVLPYLAEQLQSCLGVFLFALREAAVRDYSERIVAVFRVELHSLIVVSCQHHLRPAPHSQRGAVGVECLRGEALALGEDKAVESGQQRRIEAYAVLHEQNHLHACLGNVVFKVHLVLYQFYDGQNQVGVAQPAEHILKD